MADIWCVLAVLVAAVGYYTWVVWIDLASDPGAEGIRMTFSLSFRNCTLLSVCLPIDHSQNGWPVLAVSKPYETMVVR